MRSFDFTPELELTTAEIPGDHDREGSRVLRADFEAIHHFREITRSEDHPEGLELMEVFAQKGAVVKWLPEVVTALLRHQDPELEVRLVRRAVTFVNFHAVLDEVDALLDRALEGKEELDKFRGGDSDRNQEEELEDPSTSGS